MRINGKIIKWRHLGGGGFNKTSVSEEPFSLTINGKTYHQYWVLKVPRAFGDCELSRKMNAPSRAVRIWNDMHPYSPAIEYPQLGGWLAPYKGSIEATDEETALQQLEDYRLYRRIFADACGYHNYLNVNGKIECIDVDVSHHRNSPLCMRIDDEVIQFGKKNSNYGPYWHQYKTLFHRPKSVQMTKTLLYLEQQLNAEEILDCYLIPEMIDKLHSYERYQRPLCATTLQQLFEQTQQSNNIRYGVAPHTHFFKPIGQLPRLPSLEVSANNCNDACAIS